MAVVGGCMGSIVPSRDPIGPVFTLFSEVFLQERCKLPCDTKSAKSHYHRKTHGIISPSAHNQTQLSTLGERFATKLQRGVRGAASSHRSRRQYRRRGQGRCVQASLCLLPEIVVGGCCVQLAVGVQICTGGPQTRKNNLSTDDRIYVCSQ